MRDLNYLLERVSALDANASLTDQYANVTENLSSQALGQVRQDLFEYIQVLRRVFYVEEAWTPVVKAHDADEVIAGSRLLTRLGSIVPQTIDGKLDRSAQYWLSTAKFNWNKPREPYLSESNFVDAENASIAASTKPFYVGLYTYTGISGSHGMWREYVERAVRGTGFERPWHIWKVQANPGARVWEVDSASAWANLNVSYPCIVDGLIYPDWFAIGAAYDAVHLSAMAIAAIQGVRISTSLGVIAPSYWDVESTLWLHWRLDDVSEVEVVA